MNLTITLPLWLLVVAVLLLAALLLKPLRRGLRNAAQDGLKLAQQRARQLGYGCQRWLDKGEARLREYFVQLASLRLRFGLLDVERQFRRHQSALPKISVGVRRLIAGYEDSLSASLPETPDAPEWVAAVEAVAALPAEKQSESLRGILKDMQRSAEAQHREAMREYRWAMTVRNRSLLSSQRDLRRLSRHCASVEALTAVGQRQSRIVNEAMQYCEERYTNAVSLKKSALAVHVLVALGLSLAGAALSWQVAGWTLDTLVGAGLSQQVAQVVTGVYCVVLLLLGAIFSSSVRWSAMLLPLAELDARPRHYLATVSALTMVSLGGTAVAGLAAQVYQQLLAAGWQALSAQAVVVLLWMSPLLMSLQVLALERLLRVCRPLICFAAAGLLLAAQYLCIAAAALCRPLASAADDAP